MTNLPAILKQLNFDEKLSELSEGRISIPYLDDFNVPDSYRYPYPPALIPLFLKEDAGYYGVLCHFFSERRPTIVEYSLEWGYMLEIARNANQLYAQMILDMDMLCDGLDNKITSFCKKINFNRYKEVDAFAEEYGNMPDDYDKLAYLSEDTPLTYVKTIEAYTGDYPSSEHLFNANQIHNCCSFEIVDKSFLINKEIRDWQKEGKKKDLFYTYMEQGDLKSAWFTLNSTFWNTEDATEALVVLKNKAQNPLLDLIAHDWINRWSKNKKDKYSY